MSCQGSHDVRQKLDYFTRTCKASRIKLFCKLFWGLVKQQYPRCICAKDYPLYSVSATPHSWCLPAVWMLGWWRPLPGQHRHLQGTVVLSSGMSLTCSLWSIACTQKMKGRNLVFYTQSTCAHRKRKAHSHVTSCWYNWQASNACAHCCPGCQDKNRTFRLIFLSFLSLLFSVPSDWDPVFRSVFVFVFHILLRLCNREDVPGPETCSVNVYVKTENVANVTTSGVNRRTFFHDSYFDASLYFWYKVTLREREKHTHMNTHARTHNEFFF